MQEEEAQLVQSALDFNDVTGAEAAYPSGGPGRHR